MATGKRLLAKKGFSHSWRNHTVILVKELEEASINHRTFIKGSMLSKTRRLKQLFSLDQLCKICLCGANMFTFTKTIGVAGSLGK